MKSTKKWLALLTGVAMLCATTGIYIDGRLPFGITMISAAYAEVAPLELLAEETASELIIEETINELIAEVTEQPMDEPADEPTVTETPVQDTVSEVQEKPAPAEEAPVSAEQVSTPVEAVSAPAEETPVPIEEVPAPPMPGPEAEAAQPEVTDELPAAPAPEQNAALRVTRLYFVTDKEAAPDARVTMELTLRTDLPSGSTLQPFGISLPLSEQMTAQTEALSDGVTYTDGVLWVERAAVQDERVTVGGKPLSFKISIVPFREGTEGDSVTIRWTLLDASGQSTGLSDRLDETHRIRHRLTIRRMDVTPTEETTELTETTAPTESTEATAPTESTEATAPTESTEAIEPTETTAPTESTETTEPDGSTTQPEQLPASEEVPTIVDEVSTVLETTDVQATSEPSAEIVTEETDEHLLPPTTETPEPVEQIAYLEHNIAPSDLRVGDTLVLAARLVGFDGVEMLIQWQQLHDGVWNDIEGALGFTCQVKITEENFHDSWRYVAKPIQ